MGVVRAPYYQVEMEESEELAVTDPRAPGLSH